jgi:peptidyl-prolyl cis-trans isomerase B (cyclophilin B)
VKIIKGSEYQMKKGTIELENGGIVEIEFLPEEAPNTVANFEKLANSGFYNGLSFHRVIPGFVAQGGCPVGNGTGGPGYTIDCETATNTTKHTKGVLSMAHAGRNTGGSQFFIVYEPQPHLDGVHTVFGKVVNGMEHIDAVKQGDKMKEVKVWDAE